MEDTTECGSNIGVEFQSDASTMTCERLISSISRRVVLNKDDKEQHCYGIVFYVLVFTLIYSFAYI